MFIPHNPPPESPESYDVAFNFKTKELVSIILGSWADTIFQLIPVKQLSESLASKGVQINDMKQTTFTGKDREVMLSWEAELGIPEDVPVDDIRALMKDAASKEKKLNRNAALIAELDKNRGAAVHPPQNTPGALTWPSAGLLSPGAGQARASAARGSGSWGGATWRRRGGRGGWSTPRQLLLRAAFSLVAFGAGGGPLHTQNEVVVAVSVERLDRFRGVVAARRKPRRPRQRRSCTQSLPRVRDDQGRCGMLVT
eukprot:1176351-Prorocentrum_minimum.AAC.1